MLKFNKSTKFTSFQLNLFFLLILIILVFLIYLYNIKDADKILVLDKHEIDTETIWQEARKANPDLNIVEFQNLDIQQNLNTELQAPKKLNLKITLDKGKNKLGIVTDKLKTENENYFYEITYPQLNSNDQEISEKFNQLVKTKIDKYLNQFTSTSSKQQASKNRLTISYEVTFENDKLVSIYLLINQRFSENQNPSIFYEVINYDLIKNTEIKLDELFLQNTPYTKKITSLIEQKITTDKTTSQNFSIDHETEDEPFRYFNISPGQFLFFINQYFNDQNINPIIINFDELGNILNTESVLNQLYSISF